MLNTENRAYLQVYVAEWSRSTREQTRRTFYSQNDLFKVSELTEVTACGVKNAAHSVTRQQKVSRPLARRGCALGGFILIDTLKLEIKRNLEKEEDSRETEVSLLQLAAEECGRGAVETC